MIEQTNFEQFISALMQPVSEIESLYAKLATITDIDLMTGVNLDVIGQVVGASRTLSNSVPVLYFGFSDQVGAVTFGDEGNVLIGAPFREETAPAFLSSVLTDEQYRRLIKATIIRNYSKGTGDDVLNALSMILDTDLVFVHDAGSMIFGIGIGRILSFQELVLATQLNILPRPAAVNIGYRVMFDNSNFFGFDDTPNAIGFIEEGAVSGGGQFATEF